MLQLLIMPNRSKMRNAVIPIAWAEMTARGQEKMWLLLKRIGILKNVNFMTGHAAMVVVTEQQYLYFDFGRYLTQNGFGRARGANTDPKLEIKTKPEWSDDNRLLNLHDLCVELEELSDATHGLGPISLSVLYEIDSKKVLNFIQITQEVGEIVYGAMSLRKLNCARFVTKAILAGHPPKKIKRLLRYPLLGSTTPLYNVVVCGDENKYTEFQAGKLTHLSMSSFGSLLDLAKKCSYSFRSAKAKELPSDERVGFLQLGEDQEAIFTDTTYLGGIGEGAFHRLEEHQKGVLMKKYDLNGNLEFEQCYSLPKHLSSIKINELTLLHDSHFSWITVRHSSGWTGRLMAC